MPSITPDSIVLMRSSGVLYDFLYHMEAGINLAYCGRHCPLNVHAKYLTVFKRDS